MDLFAIRNVRFKDVVSFQEIRIEKGLATFICGKSGIGKSTLLKLLNASISASQGQVTYLGKPIRDYDPILLRREVALVAQNVFLFDDTIRNNFVRFYGYREEPPPDDRKISACLSLCMADFSLDANCRELSGGQRQRVFISICLSFAPKVLMLDEPTAALDQATSHALIRSLKTHCQERGMTLIAITHDRALAQHHADAIIDLNLEA